MSNHDPCTSTWEPSYHATRRTTALIFEDDGAMELNTEAHILAK